MKRLTILRHAKSSWKDRELNDFDRPLNARGRKAARLMGREMTERRMHFDSVLASPAIRIRETIDGVSEGHQLPSPIRFEPRIYEARVSELMELIGTLPDEAKSALLVCHNTSAERLVLKLAKDDERGLRKRVEDKFPTAGLAAIELPVDRWSEVQPDSGDLVELIYPSDLED
jgi:phosphohistidine phosphatase